MRWISRVGILAILCGPPALLAAITATPAAASCVATPHVSPYRFIGTVIRVENAGRTATVRTDDGRTVTVHGSGAKEPNAATSVDRAYETGVRYEFHPINDSSPYQDNACTATHPIATASGAGAPGAATDNNGATVPAGGADGWLWWSAGIGALVLAIGGVWWTRRRLRPA